MEQQGNGGKALSLTLFAIMAFAFLLLKSYSLHWDAGDDNVYFYMAWAMQDHGSLPYADFFFAHPPLHLLPGAILFWLFGFSLEVARAIPIVATLIGAFFLYVIACRQVGLFGAVTGLSAYLFTFHLLIVSTHFTGINLAVMWMAPALWAFSRDRPALAGILMALGAGTGNYVIPGAFLLGALITVKRTHWGWRYLLGFGSLWLYIQAACLIVGGSAYINSVYTYHFDKPAVAGIFVKETVNVMVTNHVLFLSLIVAPALALLDRWSHTQEPAVNLRHRLRLLFCDFPSCIPGFALLWVVGYLSFFAMQPRIFVHYYILFFPPLALAVAYSAQTSARIVARLVQRSWALDRPRHFLAGLTLLVAVVSSLYVLGPRAGRAFVPHFVRSVTEHVSWIDSPYAGWLNGIVRYCFWGDRAEAGVRYSAIREMLYHEHFFFERAETLARYTRDHTTEKQTLLGDPSVAGLVALLAGRRLSHDEADTNMMRFSSGATDPFQFIQRVDTPQLAFVVVRAQFRSTDDFENPLLVRHSSFGNPTIRRWLEKRFTPVFPVWDESRGGFVALRRKGHAPLIDSH